MQYIDLSEIVHVMKAFLHHCGLSVHVVVQYYPWVTFYFPLFLGMVMYDNEFETKENKIKTTDKIEGQHTHNRIQRFINLLCGQSPFEY